MIWYVFQILNYVLPECRADWNKVEKMEIYKCIRYIIVVLLIIKINYSFHNTCNQMQTFLFTTYKNQKIILQQIFSTFPNKTKNYTPVNGEWKYLHMIGYMNKTYMCIKEYCVN